MLQGIRVKEQEELGLLMEYITVAMEVLQQVMVQEEAGQQAMHQKEIMVQMIWQVLAVQVFQLIFHSWEVMEVLSLLH